MSDLLQHQIEYYQARAQEYDEWFYRHGHYDWGEDKNNQWRQEAQIVRDQLLDTSQLVHILEMAPGTGIWTQELVKISQQVTALDASPEMIDINRAKVQSDSVTYKQVNLFQWQPETQYDMVFFGFWLSHVPPDKLSPFLQSVAIALKPNGRFFFIDSQRKPTGTSKLQNVNNEQYLQKRTLNDGSEFEIVKIYYDPDVLTQTFLEHGLAASVQATTNYFIYADGKKAT